MINLLPHEKKAEIRAGRVNVVVRQYIIMLGVATLFLAVVVGAAYILLHTQRSEAQRRFAESSRKLTEYEATKQQADTFRSQLGIAKQVLDKEVVYSALLLRIAASIPSGVVIDNLSLDSQALGTPILITAHAKNKAAALRLKQEFQKRTDLYKDPHFEGLDFETSGQAGGDYPITVRINVTINQEALR